MKKTILLTLATAVLLGGGVLIYKDAKAEIEPSITESCQQRQAQMREHQEERLGEAVESGVITEDQANALQSKREEMRTERNKAREEHRTEMHEWAKENGIDLGSVCNRMGGK